MAQRDLTRKQFIAACNRQGIHHDLLGFYNVGNGVLVNILNANTRNRRARLAYLVSQQTRILAKAESKP